MANIIITVSQNHICIYRSRNGSNFNVYYPSTTTTITDNSGGGLEHNNLQPYITVYICVKGYLRKGVVYDNYN